MNWFSTTRYYFRQSGSWGDALRICSKSCRILNLVDSSLLGPSPKWDTYKNGNDSCGRLRVTGFYINFTFKITFLQPLKNYLDGMHGRIRYLIPFPVTIKIQNIWALTCLWSIFERLSTNPRSPIRCSGAFWKFAVFMCVTSPSGEGEDCLFG